MLDIQPILDIRPIINISFTFNIVSSVLCLYIKSCISLGQKAQTIYQPTSFLVSSVKRIILKEK